MWFSLLSALWQSCPEHRTARRQPVPPRLTVEVLEDRTVPSFLAPVTSPGGGNALTAADFNHDGRDDVVVFSSKNRLSVSLSNGDGSFSLSSKLTTAKGELGFSPYVSDVNGDGKLDIVATTVAGKLNYETYYEYVWLGNDDGTLGPPTVTSFQYGFPGYIDNPQYAVADFNHDGTTDAAFASPWWSPGVVALLLNNPDGTTQPLQTYDAGKDPGSIAAGDFNGDGWIDLVVVNSLSTGQPKLSVVLNDRSW